MSKITIVPEDGIVIIDGDSEKVVFTGNPNIHAIHWDEDANIGEVEYTNKANETINSFAPYAHVIADHGVSKAARLQKEIDDAADEFNVLTQQEKRDREYPQVADQLSALHYDRAGDSAPLAAIEVAMDIIDTKYPL